MLEGLNQLLKDSGQPGLAELREVLRELLDGDAADGCWLDERQLSSPHPRVFRARFGVNGGVRSFVIKRLEPAIAQRSQLVTRRWLPAIGLGDCGPGLLGVAAERSGESVWHVYEDFGDCALGASAPEGRRVQAAVELIARIHTQLAGHALLGEIRLHGGDLGIHFCESNVRDAIYALEALQSEGLGVRQSSGAFEPSAAHPKRQRTAAAQNARAPSTRQALRDRLLKRLYTLRDQLPRRAHAMTRWGGPETLLHGDLWATNVFVIPTADGWRARLIDWDHVAVGPPTYDLSTFLLRFPSEHRLWVLDLYRKAVAEAGWRLPEEDDLNSLFETHEYARFANRIIWPAIAIARDGAEWGFDALAEVEQWFEEMQPVLHMENTKQIPSEVLS